MGAFIRGCHVIAKGDPIEAAKIAPIIEQKGLIVNQSFFGKGAWAFYIDMVLLDRASKPMVVFDVDKDLIIRIPAPLPNKPDYAFMRLRSRGLNYVKVDILGFINLPGFKTYNGRIGVI